MKRDLKMINTKLGVKGIVYFVYLVIVTLLGSEIVVRNAPNWIPDDLVGYLSQDAMLSVFNERGRIQDKEPPVYHYRPFQKLNWNPHIALDENGYRNSVPNQTEVDTVLLGDSIVFAQRSEIDLGDLFREKGLTALNLAMGGYSPQHYRDVYKKYVIDKDVKHYNVIVNIFVGNDFADSIRYPWDITPTGLGKSYYPWVVNLIIGAFDFSKADYVYNVKLKESKHQVSLPYKEIGIGYIWWTPKPSDSQWNKTDEALNEILQLANQAGAKVSFVIVPSPASVYGVKLHPSFSPYVEYHNNIVNNFKTKYGNIDIVDPNSQLAVEIEKKFLYVADSDCHFNTYGTKVYFDIISNALNIGENL